MPSLVFYSLLKAYFIRQSIQLNIVSFQSLKLFETNAWEVLAVFENFNLPRV